MIRTDGIETYALIVEGGIGKNIMATAVVRAIRKSHPNKRIVVVAGYPDVFVKNPLVYKVFNFNNPLHFYESFIEDRKTQVLKVEPYLHPDYVSKRKHLVQCWCEQIGVPDDGIKPDIFLYESEIKTAKAFLAQINRPVLLMQIEGGKNPEQNSEESRITAEKTMYRRNLPVEIAQEVVNRLKKKYQIILVKGQNQRGLVDTMPISTPGVRPIFALVPYVDKVLAIDSFLQHACAALSKPAVVIWGGTSPVCLGYSEQKNITKEACPTPFCHRPNSYMFDVMPNGQMWDCPYDHPCLKHSVDEIISATDT